MKLSRGIRNAGEYIRRMTLEDAKGFALFGVVTVFAILLFRARRTPAPAPSSVTNLGRLS